MPPLVRSRRRRCRRRHHHPGRESQPFVKCHTVTTLDTLALSAVLAATITQASRRIMSPAAESCQSDTWTARQRSFHEALGDGGRLAMAGPGKQTQQMLSGHVMTFRQETLVCNFMEKKKSYSDGVITEHSVCLQCSLTPRLAGIKVQ